MRTPDAFAIVILAAAILGVGGLLAAQSALPRLAPATLDDLLAEVRGLRSS